MRNISDGSSEIVGYRFHPTDKELVDHYLRNKILGRDSLVQAINEIDAIFCKDPWELPRCSKIDSDDQIWYFFSRRGEMKRVRRTTDTGFWKITGKTRKVKGKNGCADKKSLVFYEGSSAESKWTPWVIHEYTFTSEAPANTEGIFLCILKKKDEKANISPVESSQPGQVADEEIRDNSSMFNPNDVLATLKESDRGHEHQLPSSEDLTNLHEFSGSHDILPHLSSFEEPDDESWTKYLTDDDELYLGERSSEPVLGDEGCVLPLVDTSMTCPEKSSRKRSRFEDVHCGAIANEEYNQRYEYLKDINI